MIKNRYTQFIQILILLSLSLSAVNAYAEFWSDKEKQSLPTLAPMIEKVSPSVVRITVKGKHEVKSQVPEAFEQFFRRRGRQPQMQAFQALGSGVVFDANDGYIVTNAHVVHEADEITVVLNDGRQFSAEKVGTDDEADIALLKIDADELTQIELADSDKVKVGDFAVAIGNPFGLNQTVTSGIVSAIGRSDLNIEAFEDFIQTDAAINSGNSGGALVDLNGHLMGINTAILGPNGGNIGIGFAIPSNMMKNLVNQIIEFGEVRRGLLGIIGNNLTADLAKSFDLESKHGVFVSEVTEDSAADQAGIKAGDVILSLNGKNIKSINELRGKVGPIGAGKNVKLVVVRDGEERHFTVKLQSADVAALSAQSIHPMLEGAILSNGEKGVRITSINTNSVAARLGLKKDDVIVGVNRHRIDNLKQLRNEIKNIAGAFALNILRGEATLYLIVR